jgi:hypothetical protein
VYYLMKTAVLLTGALRTISKVLRYMKQNLLLHPDVHVFACLQNTTNTPNDHWNHVLRMELGVHCISIIWQDQETITEWVPHRERLLKHMAISEEWKNYLRNSGSMIEYVQLHHAYLAMCGYEQLLGFQYDYVIRTRTDTVIAKPIDFHWLTWSDAEVEERFYAIKNKLEHEGMNTDKKSVFSYFMSTLLSDDVVPNLKNLLIGYLPSYTANKQDVPTDPHQLNKYLRSGKYILTIRKNLIYVVRRSLFHMIPSLANLYGTFRSPHSDHCWFNAECQFQGACYHAGLTSHEYSSGFEELPIAQREAWNQDDYFDEHFNCRHSHMLYCVVRT